jgi:hypothetical protein
MYVIRILIVLVSLVLSLTLVVDQTTKAWERTSGEPNYLANICQSDVMQGMIRARSITDSKGYVRFL